MRNNLKYNSYSEIRYTTGEWHRIKTTSLPYFTLSDVKKIYVVLNNGSTIGLELFAQKAKELAITIPSERYVYAYQFTDEIALFELFKEELDMQLKAKKISSWGELMQYIA